MSLPVESAEHLYDIIVDLLVDNRITEALDLVLLYSGFQLNKGEATYWINSLHEILHSPVNPTPVEKHFVVQFRKQLKMHFSREQNPQPMPETEHTAAAEKAGNSRRPIRVRLVLENHPVEKHQILAALRENNRFGAFEMYSRVADLPTAYEYEKCWLDVKAIAEKYNLALPFPESAVEDSDYQNYRAYLSLKQDEKNEREGIFGPRYLIFGAIFFILLGIWISHHHEVTEFIRNVRGFSTQGWVPARAVVEASHIKEVRTEKGTGGASYIHYLLYIRYRYTVDGKGYRSHFVHYNSEYTKLSTKSLADKYFAQYPAGNTIDIFIHPKVPSAAFVLRGDVVEERASNHRIGYAFILFAIFLLFKIYSDRRKLRHFRRQLADLQGS